MSRDDVKRQHLPQAILVAVDFSSSSRRALELALAWRPAGGDVIALHVVDTGLARRLERLGGTTYEEAVAKMRAQAEIAVADLVREYGERAISTMVAEGVPFTEICKIANDLDCDLIVMGKYGSGPELKDFLFGGTAEKVLRAAKQPVLCLA